MPRKQKMDGMTIWVSDYRADTVHLSRQEHGDYFFLLQQCWMAPGCKIPNDPDWIARHLGITVDQFSTEVSPLISEFFESDGNFIWQKRLLKEWKYTNKKSKVNSASAKSRWAKEKEGSKRISENDAEPVPNAMREPCDPVSENDANAILLGLGLGSKKVREDSKR